MNPAAIKANAKWIKPGGTIIYDSDNFTEKNLDKAGYASDPIKEEKLESFNVIAAPISSMVKEALKDLDLDPKSILRTKNMFALGMVYWLFDRELKYTEDYFDKKFQISSRMLLKQIKLPCGPAITMAETIEALSSCL